MLPPLHKLSLARAEEEPTDTIHDALSLNRDGRRTYSYEEIRGILERLADGDGPCFPKVVEFCQGWPVRGACEKFFEKKCRRPPAIGLTAPVHVEDQEHPFTGTIEPFWCAGISGVTDTYNPYDTPQMQWQRQYALFCNVLYSQEWESTINGATLAPRQHVFAELRRLGTNDLLFPPISDQVANSGGTVFAGLSFLDIDRLPDMTREISRDALHGCTGIKRMRLPQGLGTIGPHAFARSGLEEIVIPDSVHMLQEAAFAQCEQLKRVTLPELLVHHIPERLFAGCVALTQIHIPDIVTNIYNRAFMRTGLTAVVLPTSVQFVHFSAFEDCADLRSIDQPDGGRIDTITANTFQHCTSLAHAPLLRHAREIEHHAFHGCHALESYEENPLPLSPRLTRIENNAFRECRRLQHVVLPDSLYFMGDEAFAGCTNLHEVRLPEGNEEFDAISDFCFSSAGLRRIRLPRSVSGIGRYAFANCEQMQTVVFETPRDDRSVHARYIQERAFTDCISLLGLTPPRGLALFIDNFAFYQCTQLARVTSIISQLGTGAFQGCTNLRWFNFLPYPQSAIQPRTIGDGCFEECRSLAQITLPDSVTTIGDSCFNLCYGLHTVHLGAELARIGTHAFASCAIRTIRIPSRVQRLDAYCFAYCNALRTVTFDDAISLSGIETGAFSGCGVLREMSIPYTVTRIEAHTFSGCSQLERVTFAHGPNGEPPECVAIEEHAFEMCEALAELELPVSLVTFSLVGFPDPHMLTFAGGRDTDDITWVNPTPLATPDDPEYMTVEEMLTQAEAGPSAGGVPGGGGAPAATPSSVIRGDSDNEYANLD